MELKDTQQVILSIVITDRKGNPAKVDGIPAWTTSNADVASVEPADDGMSATVKAGIPGDATIAVSADADLGAGVTELAGTADITVVPGAAEVLTLTPGEVTEQ